ncbi:MAG: hypothetical protein E7279_04405 [Lachnospiraceae bacterium]|nr:hypothetical protein [Lachnospiraceae bacterium]
MNVYDFDGTIYPTDCTVGFGFWCMNRHPKMWFTFFPKMIKTLILYKMDKIPEYLMQRRLFSYLTLVDDFDVQIEKYWDKNEKKIAPWYLAQKKDDDLIISASPTAIIEPIANRLGVRFVASEFDIKYGVFTNNLMYAKEKARYIIDQGFPMIDNFYSDSLADTPIALLAEKAHFVSNKASKVSDWPQLDPETMNVVKKKIDTGWKVHLKE